MEAQKRVWREPAVAMQVMEGQEDPTEESMAEFLVGSIREED